MKDLKELRHFLSEIPENQWCIDILEKRSAKMEESPSRCVIGHINFYLHGECFYSRGLGVTTSETLLNSLGISIHDMIIVNNGPGTELREFEIPEGSMLSKDTIKYGSTPKERVLNFLDEKITSSKLRSP